MTNLTERTDAGIADETLGRLGVVNEGKIKEVIASIADPDIRRRVHFLIERTIAVRQQLNVIDLKPFEAAQYEINGQQVWLSVSTQFLDALREVRELFNAIRTVFPATGSGRDSEIVDITFDLMEDDLTPGAWSPIEEQHAQDIDNMLESMLAEENGPADGVMSHLGERAWGIAMILREEISTFRNRLKLEAVVADRWHLLSELQEIRHEITKGIDALLMAVCSSFAPVRKEDVIPGYLTELSCSLQLRSYFRELHQRIQILNADIEALALEAVRERAQTGYRLLEDTIFMPKFGWIRAADKRMFIELRNRLDEALRAATTRTGALVHILDDALHFVEGLHAINNREILVEHDREALNLAILYLEAAIQTPSGASRQMLQPAIKALATLEGRDQELDEIVTGAQQQRLEIAPQQLFEHVMRILERL